MKTAAKPIMLCMKATSSGILVISTRLAMMAPAPPPTTKPTKTHPKPEAADTPAAAMVGVSASLATKAAVVSTAMVIPTMPNTLPRIDVVGWLKPFKA